MSRELLNQSKSAAIAINVLETVLGICESGAARGWDETAGKIVALCKAEQQRQLRLMDRTDAKLGFPYPTAVKQKRKAAGSSSTGGGDA